jgi:hypothetical protein
VSHPLGMHAVKAHTAGEISAQPWHCLQIYIVCEIVQKPGAYELT